MIGTVSIVIGSFMIIISSIRIAYRNGEKAGYGEGFQTGYAHAESHFYEIEEDFEDFEGLL